MPRTKEIVPVASEERHSLAASGSEPLTPCNRASCQPQSEIELFRQGKGTVNLACLGDESSRELWSRLALPAVESLMLDLGEAGQTAANRMLATVAGQTFADWSYTTAQLRAVETARRTPGDNEFYRELMKRQKESVERMMSCLEALDGCHPRNVRLTVGSAANINLGTQTAVRSDADTTRRPRTK